MQLCKSSGQFFVIVDVRVDIILKEPLKHTENHHTQYIKIISIVDYFHCRALTAIMPSGGRKSRLVKHLISTLLSSGNG